MLKILIDNPNKYDILNSLIGKADFLCQTSPLVCEERHSVNPINRRTRAFLLEDKMPKGLKGFKKGYTPWNKGKKLPYPIWNKNKKCPSISKKLKGRKLSIETRLKMAKRIPWNKGKTGTYTTVIRFLIGSKRIRIDNGKKRRWIKIAQPNKWIQFSHYVYQKLTGKNTYNQIIHHKDENSLNDNFKNLQLVNRTEHMNLHRNKYLTHNIGRKHSKQICLNQSIRIKKWWKERKECLLP